MDAGTDSFVQTKFKQTIRRSKSADGLLDSPSKRLPSKKENADLPKTVNKQEPEPAKTSWYFQIFLYIFSNYIF